LRRWLKEPLLHFALLGVGLFALYRLVSGGASTDPDEIVVDEARVASLAEQFLSSWRRPPTRAELEGLIESYVRDEVLYREGLALGLDRDDAVIRSRVRLKMEVLGDSVEQPVGEADLEAWLAANALRYATPARYEVRQVFFDPARHGARYGADVAAALRELARETASDPAANPAPDSGADSTPDPALLADAASQLGDATLLPAALADVTRADVAAQLGEEVAAAVAGATPGRWFGPVRSSYGDHLLRVEVLRASEAATLADVRDAVERDVRYERAQTARDALYERLRARYTVRIERSGAGGELDAKLAAEQ
jgi:parvulin-like peptidyl-prolyl cis-trans isomerase-like protein